MKLIDIKRFSAYVRLIWHSEYITKVLTCSQVITGCSDTLAYAGGQIKG